MKAPNSFWNPHCWCDFHNDHSHNTEDCATFKMEVINIISGGLEVSGITYVATKKSTINAKNGQEARRPKRLLLGTSEMSFTAKEQEMILAPHHDALVISLIIVNCLVKKILLDNGSSTNIFFLATYNDLVMFHVYAERINMSTKFLVVDCKSSYNMILGRSWIHDMGAVPSTLHQMMKFPTLWS
ncbi:hypothetical protein N665_0162s0047 [Sinapis alba]|nr:hypothetical protein N665_0162s0047 [Sinapis alba]